MLNPSMKRARISKLMAFIIATLTFSWCLAAESATSAMALIKKTGMGRNLTSLSYQYAQGTVTYQMIVVNIGHVSARSLLLKEINAALPKYQDQWDKNLAEAYAETFSAAELESLAENPKDSPYVAKVIANREQIGRLMHEKSIDLLRELIAKALLGAFSSITPKQ